MFFLLLAAGQTTAVPSGIIGTWRGTFNAQPSPSDPRNRERIFRFELSFRNVRGKLEGTSANTSRESRKPVPIPKGQCKEGLCCFEVVDDPPDGVSTWCVEVRCDRLEGARNGGEMMPGYGFGLGARFFEIKGRKDLGTKTLR